MFKINLSIISIATILVLVVGCSGSRQVSFKSEVQPIFKASCISCHDSGEGSQNSGLVLNSYESLMKGTKLGPVVEPESAISSTLYLVISHKVDSKIQMPPHHHDKYAIGEGEPLSEEQIETIKIWLDQGAKNN